MMPLIEICDLTKDYGNGRGIFDINLTIEEGEVFGFVGTNGAGKTTTIRHLMGFLKPDRGRVTVAGLDAWKHAAEIKKKVGYVPGEIAFPDARTGTEFLRRQAELLGVEVLSYAESIIDRLQLDPTAHLKRMSKGMKQKTAIVASLLADAEILILDEPTTGLDPLMRREYLSILAEQKEKGKTIFMSSHLFEEVEELCDKVALIKDGKLIDIKATKDIKHHADKVYTITFATADDFVKFLAEPFAFKGKDAGRNEVQVQLNDRDINRLFQVLKNYRLQSFSENKYTLEQYFNNFY